MGKINEGYYIIPRNIVRRYGVGSPEVCIWIELLSGADRSNKTTYTVRELCAAWGIGPARVCAFVSELVDQGLVTQQIHMRKRTELDFTRLYEDSDNATGNTTVTPRARSHSLYLKGTKDIPPSDPPDEGFNSFWSAYPRKVAKQDALKAWKQIKPNDEERQAMLPALEKFKRSEDWQKEGGKYIPHPATWLRGRRWEDELAAPESDRPLTVVI